MNDILNPMQKQTFRLSVPPGLHESILEAVTKLEHVEEDGDNEGIVVTPPDGDGLVFRISPIADSHDVEVTILKNPNEVHLVKIRAQLRADIEEFEKTGKVARYEQPAEDQQPDSSSLLPTSEGE